MAVHHLDISQHSVHVHMFCENCAGLINLTHSIMDWEEIKSDWQFLNTEEEFVWCNCAKPKVLPIK